MRNSRLPLLVVTLLLTTLTVSAQDRKKISDEASQYVVSAKAGIVSVISGDVKLKRGTSDWETVIEGDELKAGDVLKTGAFARAEVLLNPGTFLRLSENTEFAFPDLTTFKLKLSLLAGAAILEASAVDVAIKFTTPNHMFTIAENGLYRFNAEPNGKSEMLVYKGKVTVAGVKVKSNKMVVVDNAPPAVLAFDKKAQDDFDNWSRDRAKTLIAANKKLSDRRMRNSLSRGFYSNMWVYDPWLRSYTFLPGWSGFNSPYGGSYSNCNPYWYYNGYRGGYGNGGGGNGNWSGGSGGSTGGDTGGGGSTGGGSRGTGSFGGSRGDIGGPSTGGNRGSLGGSRGEAGGIGGGRGETGGAGSRVRGGKPDSN